MNFTAQLRWKKICEKRNLSKLRKEEIKNLKKKNFQTKNFPETHALLGHFNTCLRNNTSCTETLSKNKEEGNTCPQVQHQSDTKT